jgi:arylsulfatase A-like enzyme
LASAVVALCALMACGSSAMRKAVAVHIASKPPPTIAAIPPPASSSPGRRGRSARPNIVFVLTDDLAWNLVRYMPHVLGMQRSGETFSNYFVTDSLCCPSRASILTGRFPHNTQVLDNGPPYGGYAVFHQRGEELETFALALQRKGYRTALMGKYLNGYQPGRAAFEAPEPGASLHGPHVRGGGAGGLRAHVRARAAMAPMELTGPARAMPASSPGGGRIAGAVRSGTRSRITGVVHPGPRSQLVPGEGGASPVPPGWNAWDVVGNGYPEFGYTMNSDGALETYGYQPQEYLTDVLARKGVDFIDRAAAQRRPFMLELATFAPHAPYVPAPRDAEGFPALQAPRTPAFDATDAGAPAWLRDFMPLEAAQIEQIDEQFRRRAQAVQAVDAMIGQIEATLAARGLARNTYIVFSSDNGLHMGEHRLMPGKQTAFDSDIRVPLIVVGPGVPAGEAVEAMTENIDLCPTFEQLGGAPIGAHVDGHSLLGLLHGRPARGWRRDVLVEHHGPDITPLDPDLPTRGAGNPPSYEALRTPESLYVEYDNGEREFYDLRNDPFELHNLATQLTPARTQQLHEALVGIEVCHGRRSCWRAQHARV